MHELSTPHAAQAASPSAAGKSTDQLVDVLTKAMDRFAEAETSIAAGNVAANAPAATGREPTTDVMAARGLLEVIEAYRDGTAAFNRQKLTDDDEIQAYAAKTYEPPFEVLRAWSRSAVSQREAVAALKVALEELDGGCTDVVESMIRAALPVFELQRLAAPAEKISPIYDAVRDAEAAIGISLSALAIMGDSVIGSALANNQTGARLIDDVADLTTVMRMVRRRLDAALEDLSDLEFKQKMAQEG